MLQKFVTITQTVCTHHNERLFFGEFIKLQFLSFQKCCFFNHVIVCLCLVVFVLPKIVNFAKKLKTHFEQTFQ